MRCSRLIVKIVFVTEHDDEARHQSNLRGRVNSGECQNGGTNRGSVDQVGRQGMQEHEVIDQCVHGADKGFNWHLQWGAGNAAFRPAAISR